MLRRTKHVGNGDGRSQRGRLQQQDGLAAEGRQADLDGPRQDDAPARCTPGVRRPSTLPRNTATTSLMAKQHSHCRALTGHSISRHYAGSHPDRPHSEMDLAC
jgi:hypothetical protein